MAKLSFHNYRRVFSRVLSASLIGGMIFASAAFVSCQTESDDEEKTTQTGGKIDPSIITEAKVIETTHLTEGLTVFNFIYPSYDPYGNPIMLSGVITAGDSITADNPAKGMILYNHYTINKADECPSKGPLEEQKAIASARINVITVSPDYYGFGITEDKNQAYCIGSANAQAAVDALIAAKKLLPTLGYSDFGTKVFNVGYSQGGQTAMAVLKLVTQKYPDIKITRTFAGAGPYDLSAIYSSFSTSPESSMPSTVIGVFLAYNEFYNLGIPNEQIFKGKLLNNLDEWILSKKYTSDEIENFLGESSLTELFTDDVFNSDSEIAKKFLEAYEKDSIANGWTPNQDESIYLYHNKKDTTVPVATTESLKSFLLDSGMQQSLNMYSGLYINIDTSGEAPYHQNGGKAFILQAAIQLMFLLTQ
ncbi:lipase family protein [uncultured Treponema sp.]|uniref:lipase family protein n=1 Tax=uncultured Treponema sp. TaxID=162155 RepID=UPI0025D69C91|nr:lipase family protein [uncultured Treponema sp.]